MAAGARAKLPRINRAVLGRPPVSPSTRLPEPRRLADPALSPTNRAAVERYRDAMRRSMEKPHVEGPGLARIVDRNYRPDASFGSGSTADGYRHTRDTGELVGGTDHVTKAQESIAALKRWIRAHPDARPGDRAAAENVLHDLQNASGGE